MRAYLVSGVKFR